ncbi:Lrp/AsnC family transcriptional regulator [Pseudonocardia acaciae]|uniref:Lrp/AsnC family transcriptional regulator n=1 Tax=Pseudonocardia acaciae TaxID=551276 RepID=UPI00048A7471|nr:Lrp/AsnC family transcriptional regulator [Pseudonocardia acaciae]
MHPLDARIAVALLVNGRGSWRELAREVGTSESTVARRVKALQDARLIQTTVLADPIRCGLGYPVVLQVACQPGAVGTVAAALATRQDVRAEMIVTGTFDLVVEVVVPSSASLADLLTDGAEGIAGVPGIARITTVSILRTFKTTAQWGQDQFAERGGDTVRDPIDPDRENEPIGLDDVDLALLERLGEDGRRSYAQLALALGMSESAARRRVERMVASGCLAPVTLVDPGLLGFGIETFMWLSVDLARIGEVARALAGRPEVRFLAASSGSADLILEATLRSQDDLYRFRADVLGRIEGIRSAEASLELKTLKRAFLPLGKEAGR